MKLSEAMTLTYGTQLVTAHGDHVTFDQMLEEHADPFDTSSSVRHRCLVKLHTGSGTILSPRSLRRLREGERHRTGPVLRWEFVAKGCWATSDWYMVLERREEGWRVNKGGRAIKSGFRLLGEAKAWAQDWVDGKVLA